MTFWKRQNYGDKKKISGHQRLGGEGGINRQSTGDFQDSENTLCDTVVVDTCHYRFVQTDRLYTTNSEP